MSQISPPIRIVLVLAVALMAAWMLFLRPKAETVEPAASEQAPNTQTGQPAVSEPGKVGEAAQKAVDATNAKTQATADSVGESTGAATAPATAAKPGTSTANAEPGAAPAVEVEGKVTGLPKPVARAIDRDKIVVLLFWNHKSADDRAVRQELRKVDERRGAVVVHAAPLRQISQYGRIARGVDVKQSPTVVVVDRELKAENLVGYVDHATIDQAVVDAMRNSGGMFTDSYLREVNTLCSSLGQVSFEVANPTSPGAVPDYLSAQERVVGRLHTKFAAIKAPAKFRGFKRATVRDHRAMVAFIADWSAYLGSKPSRARVIASLDRFVPRAQSIGKNYDRRMDNQNLLSCGSDA